MSRFLQTSSEGRAETARGIQFENSVLGQLRGMFNRVEGNVRVLGFSGVKWKVDALVNDSLIVEASVQKRLETKINSTFLKFTDITRLNHSAKGALVLENLYVGMHHTKGKKYFPTSEYRTMIQHGFPLLTPALLPRLVEFEKGTVVAAEVSSKPTDFNARSIYPTRYEIGKKALEILKSGPRTASELAKETGFTSGRIHDVMQGVEVKKVSKYYGLDEEAIYRLLIKKGKHSGPDQRRLLREWLQAGFLQRLSTHESYRTRDFANELGTDKSALAHPIHYLAQRGLIQRVGKGVWRLTKPDPQMKLQ